MKSAIESTVFSTNKTLSLRGRLVDLSVPRVMGILNVTPDSFYAGSRHATETSIIAQVEKMIHDGATFIDVGGYSSRPGADDISAEAEMNRVLPAIQLIARRFPDTLITIDTFRSAVAREAVYAGASMVNDISGGTLDAAMFETVADLQVPYILMHMRGTPQTMTREVSYENLLLDIVNYFHQRIELLHQKGVKDIIIDPGLGFAKTVAQNFELLSHLDYFKILGKPILVGLSRKSMVWRTLGITADEALNGTTALNTVALLHGANIVRVHDVKEGMEVIQLVTQLGNIKGTGNDRN